VGYIVTAIAADAGITAVRSALTAAGLPLDALTLVEPGGADGGVVGAAGLAGASILTGGGLETGTGVPGLTSSHDPVIPGGTADVFHSNALLDQLNELEIPDDEMENYVEAVESGRTVVAYFATADNAARVETLFHDSGLAKVKRF
jgi:hypothetical protein